MKNMEKGRITGMKEQDILNKIRDSAEAVEIPECLKPEQIELKLKEEKKPVKFRWQAMHLVAASVVLVLMLGVMPLGMVIESTKDDASSMENNQNTSGKVELQQNATAPENEVETVIEEKQNAGELYQVAKSYDEVYEFLKDCTEQKYYYFVDEIEMESAGVPKDSAVAEEVTKESLTDDAINNMAKLESAVEDLSSGKQNYSTTNLQMAGVDESDIVKTNGSHIFVVKNGVVQVVKIENGRMTQVGSISPTLESFSDSVLEMYVDGDKLMLIVQQAEDSLDGTDTGNMTGGFLPVEKVCVDYAYNFDVSYSTVLYTYDISNPAKAILLGKVEQDGYYKSSRKIDDMIYLFTQDTIPMKEELLDENKDVLLELLPSVNGKVIEYDDIYLPDYGYQGLVISSVSTEKPNDIVDNTLIMNDYVEIYVSSSALYLYHQDYQNETANTQIAKFALKNGQISAVAAATVPGTIQDTFAINEYNGNLRLLTSHWNAKIGERTNQLYILDSALKPAGKIENIAEGETIYAARYFGGLAYFITYRNIDPLFVADLSDIHNPKILGELKITGYSEYLHMWGEDRLLGIGYETDAKDGSREGIKLVMFDISNPAELSILDTVVIKADYSAALYNYKCVLVDPNTNMIGFTTVNYDKSGSLDYRMYSFKDEKFSEDLVIKNETLKDENGYRGLWAGEYFYMVNHKGIKSFCYTEDYKAVDEFTF